MWKKDGSHVVIVYVDSVPYKQSDIHIHVHVRIMYMYVY